MPEPIDEWSAMPLLMTVEEAARVLRVGRSKAYDMAAQYTKSGGLEGLPVLRMGDLLRVPRPALCEYVNTGRVVQLIHQPAQSASPDAAPKHAPTRKRTDVDRSQLSLLASD